MRNIAMLLIAVWWFVGVPLAAADDGYLNGYVGRDGAFHWTNGGGDPLRVPVNVVLANPKIGLPERVQEGLLKALKTAQAAGEPTYRLQEGELVGDVMISGDGWLAMYPIAHVDQWPAGRKKTAWVGYYTDPETGHQYRIVMPVDCKNIVIQRVGAPIPCICVPSDGDACGGVRVVHGVRESEQFALPAPHFHFYLSYSRVQWCR